MADPETIKKAFERNREAVRKRPSVGRNTTVTHVSLSDGTTCTVTHKHWTFKVDIGTGEGGNDAGPGPGILERGALGSCLAIGYSQRAAVLGVPVDRIEVEVESEYDAAGMLYLNEEPPGFDVLRYRVYIDSPASREEIMQLIEDTDRHSPVLDDFRRAIPVEREVFINEKTTDTEDL